MHSGSYGYAGIILAGGRGKRLNPLTLQIPKVLLNYNGKRVIDYSIDALNEADINNISIVTAYMKDKVIGYLGDKFTYFANEDDDNIFFVVTSVAKKLGRKSIGIFLDGDSIIDKDIVTKYLNVFKYKLKGIDGIIVMTDQANVSSLWTLVLDENNFLTAILTERNHLTRVFTIIKISTILDTVRSLKQRYDLERHRKENQFLPNYELYFLGWGLIFKLMVENGAKIKCFIETTQYININKEEDLSR